MITNIHFENFRGFADLKLDHLKRVNLIVGRNNAGKTSFLEGIVITADPANKIGHMPHLLRNTVGNNVNRYFRWLVKDRDGVNIAKLEIQGPQMQNAILITRNSEKDRPPQTKWQPLFGQNGISIFSQLPRSIIRCNVMSIQSRSPDVLVKSFAQAVKRKGGEERLEKLLQTVDERVQKVRVEPAEDGNHLMVDVGLSEMLPLSQAGQGIYRLVAIFSELIGEQPELCIIDEIENGIHHSLLEQVWTGLAAVAEEMNIQIFVTTHSQECIEAAHAAFSKRPVYDFSMVQLFRVEGTVQGKVLDQKQIEAAIAGDVDLR